MPRPPFLAAIAVVVLAFAGAVALGQTRPSLVARLASTDPDSLVQVLRAAERGAPGEAAEAALLLGRLHYARAEYRLAADAYARAAARLAPGRKAEARFGAGLSWLALGDRERARATFEEVVQIESPWRAHARLGLAQAWEMAGRPDRAYDELNVLLAEDPGDVTPTALAMQHGLALQLGREADARAAGERLLTEYPRSMEAAYVLRQLGAPPSPAGAITVRLGAFSDARRAESLAGVARRSGFTGVRVEPPSGAGAPLHAVRLGPFTDPEEARRQAERAASVLGVTPELEKAP